MPATQYKLKHLTLRTAEGNQKGENIMKNVNMSELSPPRFIKYSNTELDLKLFVWSFTKKLNFNFHVSGQNKKIATEIMRSKEFGQIGDEKPNISGN